MEKGARDDCIETKTLLEIDDSATMAEAMTLIENSYWTLQVDQARPIPLTPEEPEDFMYEVCGKILCGTIEPDKERIAGRFRVYYADFESAENHGVSAFEVLDTHLT